MVAQSEAFEFAQGTKRTGWIRRQADGLTFGSMALHPLSGFNAEFVVSTLTFPLPGRPLAANHLPEGNPSASPLRRLALTVEERVMGEFRWAIVETSPRRPEFVLATSQACFAAYDTALATGYGELLRLVGPELQYGPRDESPDGYQPSLVPEIAARLDGETLGSPVDRAFEPASLAA